MRFHFDRPRRPAQPRGTHPSTLAEKTRLTVWRSATARGAGDSRAKPLRRASTRAKTADARQTAIAVSARKAGSAGRRQRRPRRVRSRSGRTRTSCEVATCVAVRPSPSPCQPQTSASVIVSGPSSQNAHNSSGSGYIEARPRCFRRITPSGSTIARISNQSEMSLAPPRLPKVIDNKTEVLV